MSSYALQGIWSYCKLGYAFTKTSLHLCYECCLVWFELSSKFGLDLNFQENPDFQYLNPTLKTHFKI